jgi:hypothetical protein
MRTESFHADDLARALRHSKIATMPELKKALGKEVDVTVFRKLRQLAYRTSYSHRGAIMLWMKPPARNSRIISMALSCCFIPRYTTPVL